ncbi:MULTISPECIES: hypothetical protein [Streptomyces]|uniref:hypothetical protein n=1 Tax=Streptomyces TaxID=1883 RepID=UPI00142ED5AB|nr:MULTISPECIES: hypothetical protein [Streptomyces]
MSVALSSETGDHLGHDSLLGHHEVEVEDRLRGAPGTAVVQLREAGLGAVGDLGFIGLDTIPDDPVVSPASRPPGTSP